MLGCATLVTCTALCCALWRCRTEKSNAHHASHTESGRKIARQRAEQRWQLCERLCQRLPLHLAVAGTLLWCVGKWARPAAYGRLSINRPRIDPACQAALEGACWLQRTWGGPFCRDCVTAVEEHSQSAAECTMDMLESFCELPGRLWACEGPAACQKPLAMVNPRLQARWGPNREDVNSPYSDTAASCWDENSFGPPGGRWRGEGPFIPDLVSEWLTTERCKASRRIVGSDINLFKRKLGICNRTVTVVTIGGSVTCGRNLGRKEGRTDNLCPYSPVEHECKNESYPQLLSSALNEWRLNICCDSEESRYDSVEKVVVHNLCVSGAGSNFWANKVQSDPAVFEQADLIIVETAQNDVRTPQNKLLENPGASLDHGDYLSRWFPTNGTRHAGGASIQGWTELLVRSFLGLPNKPTLLWLTAAWRGFKRIDQPPYHVDADALHYQVLKRYNIAQVSMMAVFSPFGDNTHYDTRDWEQHFYFNDCCHPSPIGHKMITSTLMYNLVGPLAHAGGARSNSIPKPQFVLGRIAKLYGARVGRVDLRQNASVQASTVLNIGFSVYADRPTKPGLISTTRDSKIVVKLPTTTIEPHHTDFAVLLGYLGSYRGMSQFRAQIVQCKVGSTPQAMSTDFTNVLAQIIVDGQNCRGLCCRCSGRCYATKSARKMNHFEFCPPHSSIYQLVALEGRLRHTKETTTDEPCILLVVTALRATAGSGTKVKLFDVSVAGYASGTG